MTTKKLKAAIYTRKSTEYGLEQDFNSLAAQREAGEAYIISQKSQGWILNNEHYDDGGISGGTMERPALQRLLEDVKRGHVDIIIVYKVDRLTRSLSDFARIIDLLDENNASFVSVTQQFNTSNSMGRLTLNVLLSFAQFEREVTSERIRDKILASKKKGMWMGGTVPLGYDNVDKKLFINEAEANLVKIIFDTYLKSQSIKQTCHKLNQLGLRTKERNGVKPGGCKFSSGHTNYILKNRLYIGEIIHKGKHHAGNHQPIIKQDVWDKVQAKIQLSKAKHKNGTHFKNPSLLTGLLKTDKEETLSPTHTNKQSVRYRYYITKSDDLDHVSRRYSADQIESAVINELLIWLEEKYLENSVSQTDQIETLKTGTPFEKRELLQCLIQSIIISSDNMMITLQEKFTSTETDVVDATTITVPITFKETRKGKKCIIPSGRHIIQKPDQKLIALIAKAHLWAKELQSGNYETMSELAKVSGINKSDLAKQIRLVYLSPKIVMTILEGRQPSTLNATQLRRLRDFPFEWETQDDLLNFH